VLRDQIFDHPHENEKYTDEAFEIFNEVAMVLQKRESECAGHAHVKHTDAQIFAGVGQKCHLNGLTNYKFRDALESCGTPLLFGEGPEDGYEGNFHTAHEEPIFSD